MMGLGAHDEIGGAVVRRRFTYRGESMVPGSRMTPDAVLSMPIGNRRALIRSGHIDVFPPAPAGAHIAAEATRHVVNDGFGKFSVIAGVKLNDRSLTKDEAEELATRPD